MAADCFHCGEAVPAGTCFVATLGGEQRPMCCAGCKAVAEFIDSAGMGAFYEHRAAPPPDGALRPVSDSYAHFDTPAIRNRYVAENDGRATASIDIGGMYCSACSWLLDRALAEQPGIESVDVSPAAKRAVVSWDAGSLSFGAVLQAIANVGFKPRPVGATSDSAGVDDEYRGALRRLIVAAAAGMQVMMFAFALYAGERFGIEGGIESFLRTISLLVALPIVFYSSRPFFAGAWRGIRMRRPGMDVPVALAISIAFTASLYAVWSGAGAIYFDSVAMFVLFLSGARFLEMRARHRGDDLAQALVRMLPETARRVREDASEEVVGIDALQTGDRLRLLPGDVVPADGIIRQGELSLDESMLTGEALPVCRDKGAELFAGASVSAGSAIVEVTRTGADNSVAEIGRLLDRAQADRPRLVRLADRVASYFVAGMLLVAAVTAAAWYSIDAGRALPVLLATLVVTCPCALALATPAAFAAATARLAQGGCFLVRSRLLQVMRPGATVVFDKTGTLTRGKPELIATRLPAAASGRSAAECRSLAAAMEAASEHVLARAFTAYRGDDADHWFRRVTPIMGRGVEAELGKQRLRIGSSEFVAELCGTAAVARVAEHPVAGAMHVYLANECMVLAVFTIADKVREGAVETVRGLQAAGYRVVIASGDNDAAVAAVAARLGVDEWHAGMRPADKVALVKARRARGETVIMVGDGINDAPVLAAADASIAVDAGTALARASADAIVVGRRLAAVLSAAQLATATRRIIRQNLLWAASYNAAAVPLAASGMLAPWMAALGMSLSSLLVVGNALRLRRAAAGDTAQAMKPHAAMRAELPA